MGSENEIGGEALRARLKLYESTIMQALLNNLEGWGGLKLTEIERLESIQCNILKEILELPKSTSHVGLILELGVIPMQERIMYKQLMLFHSILHSPESRLARQLLQQQKDFQMQRCLQSKILEISKEIDLDCRWKTVQNHKKSSFKKLVKKKLHLHAHQRLRLLGENKTKLRFIDKSSFQRAQYINDASSVLAYKIIKIRLNMEDLKSNFPSSRDDNCICTLCLLDKETTEHVLTCKEVNRPSLSVEWLNDSQDITKWSKICQRYVEFLDKKEAIQKIEEQLL